MNARISRGARFEVSEVSLVAPWASPRHEGLRIAQLSDLHLGPGTPKRRVRAAIERLNELRPELAVLTGDFVTWSRFPIRYIAKALAGIEAPAYVVLGNHDHLVGAARVRRELEGLGYAVLQNSHAVLRVRGAPVAIIGVDDGFTRHDDVEKAFQGAPQSGTRLVLAHTPTTAQKLPPRAGLVCFSGHTHGGQVFAGRLTEAVMALAGQPFVRGLHEVNGNLLYVNRGLGLGRGVMRFRSPPELALFTLTRGEAAEEARVAQAC